MSSSTERWLAADHYSRIYTLTRDVMGEVLHRFARYGSPVGARHLDDLQRKIEAQEREKRAIEAAIDEGPDRWLYDAMRDPGASE